MTPQWTDEEWAAVWSRLAPRQTAVPVLAYLGTPPPVTVLCGSTRYVDVFNAQRQALTEAGHIVLSIEVVTTQSREADPQHSNPELKAALDELHRRKIDVAAAHHRAGLEGRVLVVSDATGYFGPSTRGEIDYARRVGVPVEFLVAASAALDWSEGVR